MCGIESKALEKSNSMCTVSWQSLIVRLMSSVTLIRSVQVLSPRL